MTDDSLEHPVSDDVPLPKKIQRYLILLALAVCANAGILLYWVWQLPIYHLSVATVNLQKIVHEEQQRYAKLFTDAGPKDAEEWSKLNAMTQEFSKKLSDRLSAVSIQCDCVLVNSAAVVSANAPDLTDLVRKGLPR